MEMYESTSYQLRRLDTEMLQFEQVFFTSKLFQK